MYKIKNRICFICKKKYKPTGTTQKVCIKCKKKYIKQKNKERIKNLQKNNIKNCIICNKKFQYIQARKRFCSKECQIKYYIAKRKEKNNPYLVEKKCIICNKIYLSKSPAQKYCSKKCKKLINFNLRLRFKILKRDNFTCQYCGRKAPDVILQVDHIYPKSKGGNYHPKNLKTSCQECNIGKSNIL